MPIFLRALLPLIFSLVPWLGVQYEKMQGSRHLEITLRPLPVPDLSAGSAPAPQFPSIKAASPPARFFTLPWFVLSGHSLVRVQETVLFLPYTLSLLGRLMLDGG